MKKSTQSLHEALYYLDVSHKFLESIIKQRILDGIDDKFFRKIVTKTEKLEKIYSELLDLEDK